MDEVNDHWSLNYTFVPLLKETYNVEDDKRKGETFEEYVSRLNLNITAKEFVEDFKKVVLKNYNDFFKRYLKGEFKNDKEFNDH